MGSVRSIFLGNRITEGIYVLRLHVNFPDRMKSSIHFGMCPSELVPLCDDHHIGDIKGSCGLGLIQRKGGNQVTASLVGITEQEESPVIPYPYSLATIELDLNEHTLSFFTYDRKLPTVISNVYGPLCLGISGSKDTSFIVGSFYRYTSPLKSQTKCTFFDCTPKDSK